MVSIIHDQSLKVNLIDNSYHKRQFENNKAI